MIHVGEKMDYILFWKGLRRLSEVEELLILKTFSFVTVFLVGVGEWELPEMMNGGLLWTHFYHLNRRIRRTLEIHRELLSQRVVQAGY